MKNLLRFFSLLPVLGMLCLIFCFSAQDGETSGSLSFQICHMLLTFANRIFSWNLSDSAFLTHAQSMQFIVRKAAHITEYLLLSLSIFLPLRVLLFKEFPSRFWHYFMARLLVPTFFLAVVCASLDEVHQHFVPGRYGTPLDVLIDSIGILLGCLLLALCYYRIRKKRSK